MGGRSPHKIELENAKVAKKGLYYAQNFSEGHILKEKDVRILRPEAELGSELFFDILGKELKRNVKNLSRISKGDFKGKKA